MEHSVYICGWKQENDQVLLWVKAHPRIRGIGRDVKAAEEQLLDAIISNGGAVHAVLEFDPPLPFSALEAQYRNPELCLVCGDGSFEMGGLLITTIFLVLAAVFHPVKRFLVNKQLKRDSA